MKRKKNLHNGSFAFSLTLTIEMRGKELVGSTKVYAWRLFVTDAKQGNLVNNKNYLNSLKMRVFRLIYIAEKEH